MPATVARRVGPLPLSVWQSISRLRGARPLDHRGSKIRNPGVPSVRQTMREAPGRNSLAPSGSRGAAPRSCSLFHVRKMLLSHAPPRVQGDALELQRGATTFDRRRVVDEDASAIWQSLLQWRRAETSEDLGAVVTAHGTELLEPSAPSLHAATVRSGLDLVERRVRG